MVRGHRRRLSTASVVALAIVGVAIGAFLIALAYANEQLNWIDVIF